MALHDHLAQLPPDARKRSWTRLAAHGLGLPLRQIARRHHRYPRAGRRPRCTGARGRSKPMLCNALGKVGRHLPVAVDDEHVLGLGGLDVRDPRQQVIPVGMGGKALEVHDLGVDGDLLAEELDTSWRPPAGSGPRCPPPDSPRTRRCTPAARGCASGGGGYGPRRTYRRRR